MKLDSVPDPKWEVQQNPPRVVDPNGCLALVLERDGVLVGESEEHPIVPLYAFLAFVELVTGQAQPAPESSRLEVGLHPQAIKHLQDLAVAGLHGVGAAGVAQRLVEDGLRRVLRCDERER